ncbi:hypothetical protein THRCLA_20039 [Thraustotheca clavata]|uniref:RanBP2-type domain-containing protein n=1 Tax=Thraustotheca clavata TaxID=74557 RepID=A0A1W0AC69_9STRA|nr:hypothetical protein THRCLA_20039 [Thraustotheca clavata]
MSCWRIKDDVGTASVVSIALERIAKSPLNQYQIDQFTRYLSDVNWLSTAADLRVVIASEAEWLRVELPIRLKLTIEQVLGEWDPIISVALPIAESCTIEENTQNYSWKCIKCSYVNKYEDSFCEMCYEHYSVSVPQVIDMMPSAPEMDDLPSEQPPTDCFPPPAPEIINTIDIDAESERFKAMAFALEPDPEKLKIHSKKQLPVYIRSLGLT